MITASLLCLSCSLEQCHYSNVYLSTEPSITFPFNVFFLNINFYLVQNNKINIKRDPLGTINITINMFY